MLVGAERLDTVDLALRYLGLGEPIEVAWSKCAPSICEQLVNKF